MGWVAMTPTERQAVDLLRELGYERIPGIIETLAAIADAAEEADRLNRTQLLNWRGTYIDLVEARDNARTKLVTTLAQRGQANEKTR